MDPAKKSSLQHFLDLHQEITKLAVSRPGLVTEPLILAMGKLIERGDQYSEEDNTFSAFEIMSFIEGDEPDDRILSLIVSKVARLVGQHKNKRNWEEQEDSWIDFIAYVLLLLAYKRSHTNE